MAVCLAVYCSTGLTRPFTTLRDALSTFFSVRAKHSRREMIGVDIKGKRMVINGNLVMPAARNTPSLLPEVTLSVSAGSFQDACRFGQMKGRVRG